MMTPHMYFILGFFPRVRVIYVEQERTTSLGCTERIHVGPESIVTETWHAQLRPAQQPWYLSNNQLSQSLRKFVHCSTKSVAYIRTDSTISFLQKLKTALRQLRLSHVGVFSDIHMMESTHPTDADILWCLARQAHIIHYIEPAFSSIKFKLPFHSHTTLVLTEVHADELYHFKATFNVDLLLAYKRNEYSYLKGVMYTQPFGAASSTETRIHVDTSTPILFAQCMEMFIPYPTTQEYENRMFYYNTVLRVFGHFKDPLTQSCESSISISNGTEKIRPLHRCGRVVTCASVFDHCLGCSFERNIWKDYDDNIGRICIPCAISDLTYVLGQPDVHQARTFLHVSPWHVKHTTSLQYANETRHVHSYTQQAIPSTRASTLPLLPSQ